MFFAQKRQMVDCCLSLFSEYCGLATLSILGTNKPVLKVTDMSPSQAEDPEVYYGEKADVNLSGFPTDICNMSWETHLG